MVSEQPDESPNAPVSVVLTHDEALVLFDFFARGDDTRPEYCVEHSAEQAAIWHVQGQISRHVGEVFLPDYAELLEAARARLAIDLVE